MSGSIGEAGFETVSEHLRECAGENVLLEIIFDTKEPKYIDFNLGELKMPCML